MGCLKCKTLIRQYRKNVPKVSRSQQSPLTPSNLSGVNLTADNSQIKISKDNIATSRVTIINHSISDSENPTQAVCIPSHQNIKPLNNCIEKKQNSSQNTHAVSQSSSNHDVSKPFECSNISTGRLKHAKEIGENYNISTEILGTGISGAVHVASHKFTGKKYAIKTLSLEGVGPKKAAILHNEVSIYLQLDHPNIAKLIEVYETSEVIHIVMELCTGGELYQRLASKKKYSERDAANVAKQMLSAINYCHKHRICHRDLKLENWVYADNSPDSLIKLIDFGFSRIFNPGVPMTAMHGTVYYVSPEVMDGCYHEKCDIWSIGVIVYMLLSGSPPFSGSYDHEILVRIKRGVFSFSGPRWEGITEHAKSFIRYLLQKDPDRRPSAEQALGHLWLHMNDSEDNCGIDIEVLQSMRDFALGNILRRAALGVIAMNMTSEEVVELEQVYRKFDRANQGTIPLQDLVNLLIEYLKIDAIEARRIFDRVDQTGKQEVYYSEFIASTLQVKFLKNEQLVREAFQRFDLDNRNMISLDNLKALLGDSYNGVRVEDIMAMCDSDLDGFINFEEFRRALTSDEAALSDKATKQGLALVPMKHAPPKFGKSDSGFSALHSMRKATYMGPIQFKKP